MSGGTTSGQPREGAPGLPPARLGVLVGSFAGEGEALAAAVLAPLVGWAGSARGVGEGLDAADVLTRASRALASAAARRVAQAARDAAVEDGQDPGAVVEEHALRTQQTPREARAAARAERAGLDDGAVRAGQDAGAVRTESAAALWSAACRVAGADARGEVVRSGLRAAGCATPGRVRAAVEALAARLDPGGFNKAHGEAGEARHVRVVPRAHGMAELRAYGPAFDVRRVAAGVEDAARRAAVFDREAGASRTAAQRGFDLFAGVWAPEEGGAPPRSTREVAARAHLMVKVDLAVLLGLSEEPGLLVGPGEPVPAEQVRGLARSATWQALVEDLGRVVAVGGRVLPPGEAWGAGSWPAEALACGPYKASPLLRLLLEVRDWGCAVPGCDAPAARCDVDHVRPWDPSLPAEGQTAASNLLYACRKHHLLKTHHGWGFARDQATGATMVVTPNGHTATRPPPGAATVVGA